MPGPAAGRRTRPAVPAGHRPPAARRARPGPTAAGRPLSRCRRAPRRRPGRDRTGRRATAASIPASTASVGRVRCSSSTPDQRLGAVAVLPGLAACGVPEPLVALGEHAGRPGADQGGGPGQRTPGGGGREPPGSWSSTRFSLPLVQLIGLCPERVAR